MNDAGAAGRPTDPYVPVNLRPDDGTVAPRRDVSALLAKLTGAAPTADVPAPRPASPAPPVAAAPLAPVAVAPPAPAAAAPAARPATPGLADELVRPAVPLLAPDPQQAPAGEAPPAPGGPDGTAPALKVNDVLIAGLQAGASDIHLTTGAVPTVRLSGELTPLEGFPKLTPPVLQQAVYAILTQKQREQFEAALELDFAYQVPGHSRFRVNVYRQRESIGAAFRRIPYEIKPLEDLGVPPVVGSFAGLQRGFVLVTGPTGSGKSTTLASIVDLANRTRKDHIMTVEDPIEFLHRHKGCLVNQREVGEDTKSFANALKHVLRQDPDIILVGEMRDLETISVALTAAETGHLVFGTLHTQDAAQTIDRVIDVFPPHQQQQIRVQLAGALQGVVCQTLCKRADGQGRVVATEVLVATPAIRNLIREGKTHQIGSAMQAGAQFGMHTLDQHLAELVRTRQITFEHGLEKCHAADEFRRLTGRF
ncbi:type IV pilus twitching motility protein PilT [Kineococcus sp. SYSU DK005]|uniref:type IV pilus twitching motility protein PilT n=1 Tax=Kineococcus sp. SYSU DK005 TaxID=3383126 RepID=UPI003D7EBC82